MEEISPNLFFFENIIPILIVVIIFSCITIAIIVYDIQFPKKQKQKIDRVVVIENYTPQITSQNLAIQGKNGMNNSQTCNKLNNKVSCTALDSCVWVDAKLNKKFMEKCVPANPILDTKTNPPSGSDGPEASCFKHKDKLVPWENFYYEDGGKQIKKKLPKTKCN